jgi:hypothetical protein
VPFSLFSLFPRGLVSEEVGRRQGQIDNGFSIRGVTDIRVTAQTTDQFSAIQHKDSLHPTAPGKLRKSHPVSAVTGSKEKPGILSPTEKKSPEEGDEVIDLFIIQRLFLDCAQLARLRID